MLKIVNVNFYVFLFGVDFFNCIVNLNFKNLMCAHTVEKLISQLQIFKE